MFPMILLILKFLNMGITNSCTGFTDRKYRINRGVVMPVLDLRYIHTINVFG